MDGKQRPVEKGRLIHRRLDGGDGVFIPLLRLHIEPLVKQIRQDLPVIRPQVVQMRRRESPLKEFRRDDVFLFEDPGEHYAHQVAQHGLALRAVFAVLHPPRPLGDFAVKLLPQRRRLQGRQQPLGGQPGFVAGAITITGTGGLEQRQQLGDGGAGGRRGQGGVKGRRHIDLPAGGHGQPGFQGAVGRFRIDAHGGGVGGPGAGKGAGAQGGVRPAQFPPGIVLLILHGGDDCLIARQIRLVGLDGHAGRIGVVRPIRVVGIFADALQVDGGPQVGLDDGVRFGEQGAQNRFRLPAGGDGGKEGVGRVGRRLTRPARHGAIGDVGAGQPFHQLGQLLPDGRRQRGQRRLLHLG